MYCFWIIPVWIWNHELDMVNWSLTIIIGFEFQCMDALGLWLLSLNMFYYWNIIFHILIIIRPSFFCRLSWKPFFERLIFSLPASTTYYVPFGHPILYFNVSLESNHICLIYQGWPTRGPWVGSEPPTCYFRQVKKYKKFIVFHGDFMKELKLHWFWSINNFWNLLQSETAVIYSLYANNSKLQ